MLKRIDIFLFDFMIVAAVASMLAALVFVATEPVIKAVEHPRSSKFTLRAPFGLRGYQTATVTR